MAITADDIKRLPTKYKIIIGVVLVLLLGYFYYFFFLQAALAKQTSLTETLENLERQIIQRQAVARQIERHRREIEEINENLRLALAKLPEQKDIPSLLNALSGAALSEKLDMLLFEPLAAEPLEFYAELPVKMTVRGNYRDIAAFFDSVSRLPRIVNVADAEIRGPAAKDAFAPIAVTAECVMKTYMFLDMGDEKSKQGS